MWPGLASLIVGGTDYEKLKSTQMMLLIDAKFPFAGKKRGHDASPAVRDLEIVAASPHYTVPADVVEVTSMSLVAYLSGICTNTTDPRVMQLDKRADPNALEQFFKTGRALPLGSARHVLKGGACILFMCE